MISGTELLTAFDGHQPSKVLAGTGLSELDELTGGLQAGHVWVVTGDAGEGKTTLLTQPAMNIASGGHRTQLVCPREPPAWATRRMLSYLGRTPVAWPGAHHPPPRMDVARDTLSRLPLALFAQGSEAFTPEADPYADPRAEAVLVDDVDLVGGMTPARAERYAKEGRFVAVALPREQVFHERGDRAPLRPEWARVSDVVVEVRTRSIGDAGSPWSADHRPAELRPGEADVDVHRNRWGYARTLHVGASIHYARFEDLAPSEPNDR